MKTALRAFALLVAFAGLAAASFSSSPNHALPAHMTTAVSGPQPDLPAPLPCTSTGGCVAPSAK
jgi:hypothetical protein